MQVAISFGANQNPLSLGAVAASLGAIKLQYSAESLAEEIRFVQIAKPANYIPGG